MSEAIGSGYLTLVQEGIHWALEWSGEKVISYSSEGLNAQEAKQWARQQVSSRWAVGENTGWHAVTYSIDGNTASPVGGGYYDQGEQAWIVVDDGHIRHRNQEVAGSDYEAGMAWIASHDA